MKKPLPKSKGEEILFDADRDNFGKGISVDVLLQVLEKISSEDRTNTCSSILD